MLSDVPAVQKSTPVVRGERLLNDWLNPPWLEESNHGLVSLHSSDSENCDCSRVIEKKPTLSPFIHFRNRFEPLTKSNLPPARCFMDRWLLEKHGEDVVAELATLHSSMEKVFHGVHANGAVIAGSWADILSHQIMREVQSPLPPYSGSPCFDRTWGLHGGERYRAWTPAFMLPSIASISQRNRLLELKDPLAIPHFAEPSTLRRFPELCGQVVLISVEFGEEYPYLSKSHDGWIRVNESLSRCTSIYVSRRAQAVSFLLRVLAVLALLPFRVTRTKNPKGLLARAAHFVSRFSGTFLGRAWLQPRVRDAQVPRIEDIR